jgi:hypothetical protein
MGWHPLGVALTVAAHKIEEGLPPAVTQMHDREMSRIMNWNEGHPPLADADASMKGLRPSFSTYEVLEQMVMRMAAGVSSQLS